MCAGGEKTWGTATKIEKSTTNGSFYQQPKNKILLDLQAPQSAAVPVQMGSRGFITRGLESADSSKTAVYFLLNKQKPCFMYDRKFAPEGCPTAQRQVDHVCPESHDDQVAVTSCCRIASCSATLPDTPCLWPIASLTPQHRMVCRERSLRAQ